MTLSSQPWSRLRMLFVENGQTRVCGGFGIPSRRQPGLSCPEWSSLWNIGKRCQEEYSLWGYWWKYFFQENIVVQLGNRTITSTTILTTGQVVNDQSQPRIQASFWNCIHTARALVQPALVFSYVPNIAVMYHMFFVSIGHLWSLDEDLKRGMMRIIGEM